MIKIINYSNGTTNNTFVSSSKIGSRIQLACIETGKWYVTQIIGNWAIYRP